MPALNAFNCGLSTGNTGKQDCVFEPAEIYGAILVPKGKVFTAAELQDLRETMTGLAQSDNKLERIYPIGSFLGVEDESEDPTVDTSGYGFSRTLSDGNYRWTFQFNNGKCYHQGLLGFKNQQGRFNVLFVDKAGAIMGTSGTTSTGEQGLRGLSLSELYVHKAPLPGDGSAQVYYTITFAMSNSKEYNDSFAFVLDEDFNPLEDIQGMIDVKIVKSGTSTATELSVMATMNCGSTNMSEMFGTELADPDMWVVTNAITGAAITIDTVSATATGFTLEVTGVSPGTPLNVSLADPSALESEGIVSPNGNLVESNNLRISL